MAEVGEKTQREAALDAFRRSAGFQIMFVLHSGLKVGRAIDHICASAEKFAAALREWQPIETAPKDGTQFLVTYGEWVTIAFWDRDPESEGGECFREYSPDMERVDRHGETVSIHWMPLPDPPKIVNGVFQEQE